MWASTLCPFSSSTRNMALGSGSVTVPSTSIASFFGNLRVILATGTPDPPTEQTDPPPDGSGQPVYGPAPNTVHDLRKRDREPWRGPRDLRFRSRPGGL